MRQGSLRNSDTWPYSRYVTGIFIASVTGIFLGGPILVTYREVTRDLRPAVTRHVSRILRSRVTYLARGARGESEGVRVRGAEAAVAAVQAGGGGAGGGGGALPRLRAGEFQRKRGL